MRFPAFWTTVARWWKSDRIRVAPREGVLFRLMPDAVVIIRGAAFQVAGRRVVSLPGGAAIVYDCDSERARCQLRIEPGAARPRIVLIEADTETALGEDDLEVFPVHG